MITNPYLNHMGVSCLEELHPSEGKEDTKIAITRNPWDQVVSAYFHKKKNRPKCNQSKFLYFP